MEVTRIEPFLEHLDRVHARTRRVVTLVRDDDLEWQAGPGRLTPGEMIRHLAGIERFMYAETVHGRSSAYPGHSRGLADGLGATIAYYERLHAESRALFAELSDARLAEKCLTPAGSPITVGKWLRAMIEHEAHHRGQLYFVLGLRGIATPPIYGLTSEEVQARSRTPISTGT
ncbi:MAG: DinB family protein [Gemmatimonadaceae bacterium]